LSFKKKQKNTQIKNGESVPTPTILENPLEGREAPRIASQTLLTKQVNTCTVNLKIKEKSTKKKKD